MVYRLMILVPILMVVACARSNAPLVDDVGDPASSFDEIELLASAQFETSEGAEIELASGRYRVSATEAWQLRMTPLGEGEAVTLPTELRSHEELIENDFAVAAVEEDMLHIVLLFPSGEGLESVGFPLDGVAERGTTRARRRPGTTVRWKRLSYDRIRASMARASRTRTQMKAVPVAPRTLTREDLTGGAARQSKQIAPAVFCPSGRFKTGNCRCPAGNYKMLLARGSGYSQCVSKNALYDVKITLDRVHVHAACDPRSPGDWKMIFRAETGDQSARISPSMAWWPDRNNSKNVDTGKKYESPKRSVTVRNIHADQSIDLIVNGVDCDDDMPFSIISLESLAWEIATSVAYDPNDNAPKFNCSGEEVHELTGKHDRLGKSRATYPGSTSLVENTRGLYLRGSTNNTCTRGKSAYTAYFRVTRGFHQEPVDEDTHRDDIMEDLAPGTHRK